MPWHAARVKALTAERHEIEAEAEELADSLPLLQVLTCMPGIGVKTASQILLAAVDFSAFKSAGHLAVCRYYSDHETLWNLATASNGRSRAR